MTRSAVRRNLAMLLATALLAVAGASSLDTLEFDGFVVTIDPNRAPGVYEGDLDCTRFGGSAAVQVTETTGRAGDADYLVYLPADWNGDLVLFGHTASFPTRPAGQFWFPLPLGFAREQAQMPFVVYRDIALCHGFAWAASAMAGRGMTIAEGIRDTHTLMPIARRHLPAEPERTYVTGLHAPGGSVAVALAEMFPNRYDGALAIATHLGGIALGGTYVVHLRVLLDEFYPGLVERFTFDEAAMTPPQFMAFAGALQARIQAEPDALRHMASIRVPGSERWDPDGVGLPLIRANPFAPDQMASLVSLGEGLLGALNSYFFSLDDWRSRGGGHAQGNMGVAYTSPDMTADDLADLNARVARFEADPLAARYWTFYYQPSGDLKIPLVSLRPAYDSDGSIIHEWAYARALARYGAEDWFSNYLPDRYGMITPEDMATAFRGLVDWVETGERPTWPTAP
jgi:hypothetical protein